MISRRILDSGLNRGINLVLFGFQGWFTSLRISPSAWLRLDDLTLILLQNALTIVD